MTTNEFDPRKAQQVIENEKEFISSRFLSRFKRIFTKIYGRFFMSDDKKKIDDFLNTEIRAQITNADERSTFVYFTVGRSEDVFGYYLVYGIIFSKSFSEHESEPDASYDPEDFVQKIRERTNHIQSETQKYREEGYPVPFFAGLFKLTIREDPALSKKRIRELIKPANDNAPEVKRAA